MVTAGEMQAVQVITGVAIAAWLLAGRLGANPSRIRLAILVLYLAAAVTLVGWVALR